MKSKRTPVVTYGFVTSALAWAFMRRCGLSIGAGYPSLVPVDGLYTVAVLVPNVHVWETTDRLAEGAACVTFPEVVS